MGADEAAAAEELVYLVLVTDSSQGPRWCTSTLRGKGKAQYSPIRRQSALINACPKNALQEEKNGASEGAESSFSNDSLA